MKKYQTFSFRFQHLSIEVSIGQLVENTKQFTKPVSSLQQHHHQMMIFEVSSLPILVL